MAHSTATTVGEAADNLTLASLDRALRALHTMSMTLNAAVGELADAATGRTVDPASLSELGEINDTAGTLEDQIRALIANLTARHGALNDAYADHNGHAADAAFYGEQRD